MAFDTIMMKLHWFRHKNKCTHTLKRSWSLFYWFHHSFVECPFINQSQSIMIMIRLCAPDLKQSNDLWMKPGRWASDTCISSYIVHMWQAHDKWVPNTNNVCVCLCVWIAFILTCYIVSHWHAKWQSRSQIPIFRRKCLPTPPILIWYINAKPLLRAQENQILWIRAISAILIHKNRGAFFYQNNTQHNHIWNVTVIAVLWHLISIKLQ